MPRKGDRKDWKFLGEGDAAGMPVLLVTWVEALKMRGYSEQYIDNCRGAVSFFIVFCQDRGVTKASGVTRPVIERFQRWLFYLRREGKDGAEGEPLSLRTQQERLSAIKVFFKWLSRNGYILANPASEIELPRIPPRRPPEILTVEEVEKILSLPKLDEPLGVRDRAILETLYSTGIRRKELSRVAVADVDHKAGILRVRHGKGKKERIIPIGSRALAWIRRYLLDVRPQLAPPQGQDDGTLFLSATGKPFWPDTLTQLARDYVRKAGIEKPGSCHLFRHTMATLMLENGADIRFIQEMLGHATLHATTIYTHVAIKKLKEIHTATHPGANLAKLPSLAAEDEEQASGPYPE